MVACAPRYDSRIFVLVDALDDDDQPMAETCRRVGAAVVRLGLRRPSYVHLRRFIRAKRDESELNRRRRDALLEIAADVARDVTLGLRVNAYEVAERVQEARRVGEVA
jgi:hypothetical protein